MEENKDFKVKENSFIARIAATRMRASALAIVFGKTIHLHHISRQELLANNRLLKHEYCHVQQYRRYGFALFIAKYLWESLRNGYYNNRFEVEARQAEYE